MYRFQSNYAVQPKRLYKSQALHRQSNLTDDGDDNETEDGLSDSWDEEISISNNAEVGHDAILPLLEQLLILPSDQLGAARGHTTHLLASAMMMRKTMTLSLPMLIPLDRDGKAIPQAQCSPHTIMDRMGFKYIVDWVHTITYCGLYSTVN